MTRGTRKRIHFLRRQAFEAAVADFFRSGGTMSVENRTDWHDAIVASDGQMSNLRQMAMYDLRDFCPLPDSMTCYHSFATDGFEYIEFFLDEDAQEKVKTYMATGAFEKEG